MIFRSRRGISTLHATNMDAPTCHVNITEEVALAALYTESKKIFVLIFLPLITLVGLAGNVMFLTIIYRRREMRTSTNFYLAHLAIADSLLLINTTFQRTVSYSNSPFDSVSFSSPTGCALPNFMVYMCYFASVFLITLVITERYFAICHPMRYISVADGSRYRCGSIIITLSIWGLSFLGAIFSLQLSLPKFVCITDQDNITTELPTGVWYCDYDPNWCRDCDKIIILSDFTQFCVCTLPCVCKSS